MRAASEIRMAIKTHEANNRGSRPSSIEVPWHTYKELMLDPMHMNQSTLDTFDGIPISIAENKHTEHPAGNKNSDNKHDTEMKMHK